MPGINHGELALKIGAIILNHVMQHKLGRCAGNDSFIRVSTDPDSYRGADVCVISYEKLPKHQPTPKGPLEFAPELVVEVRSPSDRHKAVRQKIEDYLSAGVKVVMVVDPETESVGVFRDDELPIRFHNGDTITIPDVLPKFHVPVKAIFE
jgi:Uma2 family endonuclease